MSQISSGERLLTAIASILMFFCLAIAPAYSQEQTSYQQSLSLQQTLGLTLKQHPSLNIFKFRQQALDGEQSMAAQSPSYQLGAELDNFAGNGQFSGFNDSELTVSLSSTIELGGKVDARLGVVKSKRSYTEVQKELQSLELLSETTRRFINLLAAQERVKLAEESLQLAQEAEKVTKRRSTLGATMKAEVQRAKASLIQAQLTLEKERSSQKILSANLSSMWNDQSSGNYTATGNLYNFGRVQSFEQLFLKVENNPSIKQFAAKERLKQSELALIETNNQSNLQWSVGLTRNQSTGDFGFTAGFSMDLFSESRNQGALKTALAEKNEIFVSRQTALLRMHDQLFNVYQNRKQSVYTVERLQKEIIPVLAATLKETQQAYQQGRYSYFEYVSARQELIAAKRKLIDAANAALIFGVAIEQLTAEPLTLLEKNS